MNHSVLLVELSIIPVGTGSHTSPLLAHVVRLIMRAGLPYQLTAAGTCLQGTWDEVMPVVRQCHAWAAAHAPHVVTLIKIEQDNDARQPLGQYPRSVEEKTGSPVRVTPPSPRRARSSSRRPDRS